MFPADLLCRALASGLLFESINTREFRVIMY